ncbi:MAG TPA: endonuclease/exonuclease/phosphatase family protein [Bacteroidia bacterium]|nr:endonuclease/exonuclease/phosphatase family protein [Bacteroidia bacterium]
MSTIAQELADLKARIAQANVPASTNNNFRMLTWNIRNLNKDKEDRAITYIAEVMKNFDIIAIQECKDSLGGLEKLQKELGVKYKFLFFRCIGQRRAACVLL